MKAAVLHEINTPLVIERRVQGSSMGSNHFSVDMPRLIEFYMRGKLHLDDWISAKLKLSEINEGFSSMKAGKAVRSVICSMRE
jgi:S-(hydroxymethyl)glutathione dehydrogenase/alcohol dehydrogenase